MKKFFLLVLAFITILFGEYNIPGYLIDIPTSYILRNNILQANLIGNFTTRQDEDSVYLYDFDMYISYGLFNRIEMSLNIYSLQDFSFSLAYRINNEHKYIPSFAIGVSDISYKPYIHSSSLPWKDDSISIYPGFFSVEAKEYFSFYTVASKFITKNFSIHIGAGRGRFVGYDSLSRFFNTDILYKGSSINPDFTVALFGGFLYTPFTYLDFISEFDGRDFNTGFRLNFEYSEFYLGISKLELLLFNYPHAGPRIVGAMNLHTLSPYIQKTGNLITGIIKDGITGNPVKVRITIYNETFSTTTSSNEYGIYKIKNIPKGNYILIVKDKNYTSLPVNIYITEDKKIKHNILVYKNSLRGIIKGVIYDKNTGERIKGYVTIDKLNIKTFTDTYGGFELTALPPGKYILRAGAKGKFDSKISVSVAKAHTTNVNISLSNKKILFYFKPGEKYIEPRFIPVLKEIAKFLKQRPGITLEIQGHTDSVGKSNVNKHVSRDRAQAVASYLIKSGISPERLIVKGYGESAPIGDNRTLIGRSMNRRVVLVILNEY